MSYSSKRFWYTLIILSIPVGCSGLMIALLLVPAVGRISGTEFCPENFNRRSFVYFRVPYTSWIFRGIELEQLTSTVEQALIDDGYIDPLEPINWHLVSDFRHTRQPIEADARFLVELLNLRIEHEDYDYYWLKWNADFPTFARIFLPVIAQMARDEMYLAIPDLMTFAMRCDTDESDDVVLSQKLFSLAEAEYRKFATIDQNKGLIERSQNRERVANRYRDLLAEQ